MAQNKTPKPNPKKFQIMILGKKRSIITLKINSILIHAVVLLGITTDKNLTFMEHIENLFRHANSKLHALPRKYLT